MSMFPITWCLMNGQERFGFGTQKDLLERKSSWPNHCELCGDVKLVYYGKLWANSCQMLCSAVLPDVCSALAFLGYAAFIFFFLLAFGLCYTPANHPKGLSDGKIGHKYFKCNSKIVMTSHTGQS